MESLFGAMSGIAILISLGYLLLTIFILVYFFRMSNDVRTIQQSLEEIKKILVNNNGIKKAIESSSSEMVENKLQQPDDQTLMEKYNITFENEKYVFSGYRYENLKDAINYAKKMNKNNN